LAKKNCDQYLKKAPESLNAKRLDEYDLIVVMEQRHKDYVLSKYPECEDKIAIWNIADPYFMPNEDAERIYQQIGEKVKKLARSL